MLWRLTVSLLVLALASASPQGFNDALRGYLPPQPSSATCRVAPVTSVITDNRIQTSVRFSTVNQINTQYITTTVLRNQVVPTTLFQTRVATVPQFQTSVIQRTTVQFNDRVVRQTIPSPPIQSVVYVTSTRVVPQVNYVTRTQIQTQVVPVEVVRTQVQTINQPVTNYRTQFRQETQVVTIPGRNVVQTRVQTVVQTSLIRSQVPGNTRFITQTQVQQQVQTSVVRGRDVVRTSYVQRQQVIPYTAVNTRYSNVIRTQQQIATRTNYVTQTVVRTQFVPQEVVRTQEVQNTVFSTRYETRVQPFTQVQTVVRTRYNTPAPFVQTREATTTSIVQVPGRDQVVSRDVVQTQQRQQIVYSTVNQARQQTVVRTVTQTCEGYNYNEPNVPFNFGK